MAGGDEFFDEFGAGPAGGEEVLFTDDDFQRLRGLFLDKALSLEDLHAEYKRALEEMLAARGKSVEWAQEHHADYPYVAAYSRLADLELIRSEAVAAAKECGTVKPAEEWTPPPPDEEPETAADYE